MTALSLSNIHKKYDKTTIIENLSLEIASGEFIVLVGPFRLRQVDAAAHGGRAGNAR